MPRDGSGVYSLPAGYLAVAGQVIQPSQHNPPLEDVASALSDSIARTGVTAVTADIPWGGFKITGLGNATADTDALNRQTGDGRYAQLTNALPFGYHRGLTLSNNVADATNDIDVAAGSARDATDAFDLEATATIIKQLDVAFAEYTLPSTASGGRDSSDNLTGAKWFNVYLIGGAGKNTQPYFSTSSAPGLPTGFSYKVRLGSIYWTGTAIKPFFQNGQNFFWSNPTPLDADTTTLGTSATSFTTLVPTGRKIIAHLRMYSSHASAFAGVVVRDPDSIDAAPSFTAAPLASVGGGAGTATVSQVFVQTNTSAQVQARAVNTSTTFRMVTLGWIDSL